MSQSLQTDKNTHPVKQSQFSLLSRSQSGSKTSVRTSGDLKEYLRNAENSQVRYYFQVYSIATLPNIFSLGFLTFFIVSVSNQLAMSYQFENVVNNFLSMRVSLQRVVEERDVVVVNALYTAIGWESALIKEKLLTRTSLTDDAYNEVMKAVNVSILKRKLAIIRSNYDDNSALRKYELYEDLYYDMLKYFDFQAYALEQNTWEKIDGAMVFLDYIKSTSIMTEIVALYERYCEVSPEIVPWFVKLYGYQRQLLPYMQKGNHNFATFIQKENDDYFNVVNEINQFMTNFIKQDAKQCQENEQTQVYRSNKISLLARDHLSRCWFVFYSLSQDAKSEFFQVVMSQRAYIIAYSILLAFVLVFGSNSIAWYGRKMKKVITTIVGISTVSSQKRAEVNEAKQKADKLLYNMMPMSIAKQLKKGIKVDSGIFDEATVLFTDVHNFEDIVNASNPLQIIHFLDGIYNTFDDCIQEFDVYKVETIRDSYMVVSGLPEPNGNKHTWEIAELALNLVEKAKNYTIEHMENSKLKLRLGIHTGMVVVGIVGHLMPRYCLFGDTVNTAARMKSYSQVWRIHTSLAFANHVAVHQRFVLEKRGEMEIKGKGTMTTCWLTGRKPDLNTEKKTSFRS